MKWPENDKHVLTCLRLQMHKTKCMGRISVPFGFNQTGVGDEKFPKIFKKLPKLKTPENKKI